jgi:uncharacterized membrane protein YesL
MTSIREYLKRQKKRWLLANLMLFAYLLLAGPITFKLYPSSAWPEILWITVALAILVLQIVTPYLIRCPRCLASFNVQLSLNEKRSASATNYCPHCGVQVDSPLAP